MTTTTASFTDADWDAMDRIVAALEAKRDLTPAAIRRIAKIEDHTRANRMLDYLVAHSEIRVSGNGAWVHYHPRGL